MKGPTTRPCAKQQADSYRAIPCLNRVDVSAAILVVVPEHLLTTWPRGPSIIPRDAFLGLQAVLTGFHQAVQKLPTSS